LVCGERDEKRENSASLGPKRKMENFEQNKGLGTRPCEGN